ncbi:MAG: FkbM family methyltransferase, partial [Pseudomonadota bacterium]
MPATDELVSLFNGVRLRFPQGDRVATFLREGWFEANDLAFVTQFLRTGDLFIDIGAHAGLYSAIAGAQVGETGAVIAIEPNPAILPWLTVNLGADDTDAAAPLSGGVRRIIAKGVSDKEGDADFYAGDAASAAYSSLVSNEHATNKIVIELTTLDHLVSALGIASPALIKIDIEGAEAAFLDGAQQAFQAFDETVLMMEFSEDSQERFGASTLALLEKTEALGFQAFDVNMAAQSVTPFRPENALWHKNVILARSVEIIRNRLDSAPARLKETCVDAALKGAAAMRLYEERQSLSKLTERLADPLIKLARVQDALSSASGRCGEIEAQLERLISADAPARADALSALLDDQVGRLESAATAVEDAMDGKDAETQETLAAMRRLAQACAAIGAPIDALTNDEANTARIGARLIEDATKDASAPDFAAHLQRVIADEIGRLKEIAMAAVSRLNVNEQSSAESIASLSRLKAAFAELGRGMDLLTGAEDNAARIRDRLLLDAEAPLSPVASADAMRAIVDDEIGRISEQARNVSARVAELAKDNADAGYALDGLHAAIASIAARITTPSESPDDAQEMKNAV